MVQTTVLIDAHCVMCNGLARFLEKGAKPSAQLEIHGIDTDEGQALIATFPERFQAMDTVYVVRNGTPYARSAGAIRLLLSMRGTTPCGIRWPGSCRFRCGTASYWMVSKVRHRFGRLDD